MDKRSYENPVIGDRITFLRTSAETGGACTEIEVYLVPGGGNGDHYHASFSETFEPVEGELTVSVSGRTQVLNPGESATVAPMLSHHFFNNSPSPVRFKVLITPGHEGFEDGLRIAYGLARDGKTNRKGIPKRLMHMAILVNRTDTNVRGFFSIIMPLLKRLYRKAIKSGELNELQAKYCS